jgi:hypothetical protein
MEEKKYICVEATGNCPKSCIGANFAPHKTPYNGYCGIIQKNVSGIEVEKIQYGKNSVTQDLCPHGFVISGTSTPVVVGLGFCGNMGNQQNCQFCYGNDKENQVIYCGYKHFVPEEIKVEGKLMICENWKNCKTKICHHNQTHIQGNCAGGCRDATEGVPGSHCIPVLKLRYLKDGEKAITQCPYTIAKVGSLVCHDCSYFIKDEGGFVYCIFGPLAENAAAQTAAEKVEYELVDGFSLTVEKEGQKANIVIKIRA